MLGLLGAGAIEPALCNCYQAFPPNPVTALGPEGLQSVGQIGAKEGKTVVRIVKYGARSGALLFGGIRSRKDRGSDLL